METTGYKSNEGIIVEKKLREQLAVAVRSIQWSYAIFWSLSTKEKGVLEWHEGCYNGDIKIRKTIQCGMDLKADETGFQRSEQLRELYKSLLEYETDQKDQRTSSSSSTSSSSISSSSSSSSSKTPLSPKDLSEQEWYYLICMSFVFNQGQGLPGRALAEGGTIWLCDVQQMDSKVFSRALLANTVVCFPYLGGVIEIGVTDRVPEDLDLLRQFKASLQDFSKPVCKDNQDHRTGNDNSYKEDKMCAKLDNEVFSSLDLENISSSQIDIRYDERDNNDEPNPNHEKYNIDCLDDSNECDRNYKTEDTQFQSWQFRDDELSLIVKQSLKSASDCTFETLTDPLVSPTLVNLNDAHLREMQRFNDTINSLNTGADDDLHYKRAVTALLRGSSKFIEGLCFRDGHDSSFVAWKKEPDHDYIPTLSGQKMLKEVLFTFPVTYTQGKNMQSDFNGHYSKSREEEHLLVLKSIVPSINKSNREMVLSNTVKYLKELEARVGELESRTSSMKNEDKTRKKSLDISEQISDNRDKSKTSNAKKMGINKRKACPIGENGPDHHDLVSGGVELKVSAKDKEVLIDMKCPYKEYILIDIMDAINHLHLDTYSVQSSTRDGVFTLIVKSKFRGTASTPAGMIKQSLWKVAKS